MKSRKQLIQEAKDRLKEKKAKRIMLNEEIQHLRNKIRNLGRE